MKKLLVILLAVMMLLSLAACGAADDGKTTARGGEADPAMQEKGSVIPNIAVKLFDTSEEQIKVIKNGKTELTGDEAAAQIAGIPPEVRKGIGEIDPDQCTVKVSTSEDRYIFDVCFRVSNDSAASHYKALYDYYKTLDGTVTKDTVEGDTQVLNMTFAWGELYRCDVIASYYASDTAAIRIGFYINGNS